MEEKSKRVVVSGKFFDFLERISSFRREGKDRRDAKDDIGDTILTVIGQNYPTPVETTRANEQSAARM
jgi:hypothetical protein